VSGKIPLGYAGEFLVAAKLCLMGYVATLTLKAHPNIDILVYNPENGKAIGLQVKTTKQQYKRNSSKDGFNIVTCRPDELEKRLDERVKNPYVFVHVLDDGTINYYVVGPEEVKRVCKENFERWVREKKPSKESLEKEHVHRVIIKDIEKYKDNWKLIEELLK